MMMKERKEFMFKIITFSDFLCESIKKTETEFGSKKPFTNKQFNKSENYVYTFFEHENQTVVVSYDDNKSLNFGILKNGEAVMSHEEKLFHFKNMQQFYGKTIYVFEKMVEHFNIKSFIVYASPFEPKLNKIYNFFVKNKNIQQLISSIGFTHYEEREVEEYDGTKFKVHSFSKNKIFNTK